MKTMLKSLAVLMGGAVFFAWPSLGQAAGAVNFSQSAAYNSALGRINYTINWTNADNISDLAVKDDLPMGTAFVSASGNGMHSDNTVTWDLGSQSAGSSGQLSLTVSVDAAQALNLWADKVVSFIPGTDKNGQLVPADAGAALGSQDSQNAALGFGGQVILAFPWPIMQDSGADAQVFGDDNPNEKAKVEFSNDLNSWVDGNVIAGGGFADISASTTSENYLRITDISDPNNFSTSSPAGFQLDAVLPLHKFPFACAINNTVSALGVTNNFNLDFVQNCSYGSYGSGVVSGGPVVVNPPASGGSGSIPPSGGATAAPPSGGGGGGSPIATTTPSGGGAPSVPEGMGGGENPPQVLGEATTLPRTGIDVGYFMVLSPLLIPLLFKRRKLEKIAKDQA